MENTNFWNGFNKQADPIVGATIGATIGAILAAKKNMKWVEEHMLGKQKGNVDSKKMFNEIKSHLPKDTVLMTNSDLHKKVKSAKDYKTMQFYQHMRQATEGNAAALPKRITSSALIKRQIPEEFHNKNIIIADDKVHPAVLAHEAGHIIDFNEVDNLPFLKRVFKKAFHGTVSKEEAAWDKAPQKDGIKGFEEKREGALDTYKRGRNYPIIGGALGAGLGGLAMYLMNKHAGAFKELMIDLEDKKAKEHKKTIPVEES